MSPEETRLEALRLAVQCTAAAPFHEPDKGRPDIVETAARFARFILSGESPIVPPAGDSPQQ